MEEHFLEALEYVNRDPILFGDYRNALTEEPRLYEDVVDYDAAKAIFEEVCVWFPIRILFSGSRNCGTVKLCGLNNLFLKKNDFF